MAVGEFDRSLWSFVLTEESKLLQPIRQKCFSFKCFPISEKALLFWNVRSLRPLVLLIRVAL
jgi:hypothetical protein